MRQSQCENTWTVKLAPSGRGCRQLSFGVDTRNPCPRMSFLHSSAPFDGKACSPDKDGAKQDQSLSCLLSHIADLCRPRCCKSRVLEDNSVFPITVLNLPEIALDEALDKFCSLNNDNNHLLRDFRGNHTVPQTELQSTGLCLPVTVEKPWTEGRGYESCRPHTALVQSGGCVRLCRCHPD